ncbi:glucosamine inositolphosphorylceramide transferase family protein [Methylobacterium sp. JK268]
MRIQIILDVDAAFAWHSQLAARLRGAGHQVAVAAVGGPTHWPASLRLLLDLERLVIRRARRLRLHAPLPPELLSSRLDGRPDLVLDLSSRPVAAADGIRLLFDGRPAPAAAVSALLDGRRPRLDLVERGRVLGSALPANEEPGLLTSGLAASFARCVDLCLREVARRTDPRASRDDAVPASPPSARERPAPGGPPRFASDAVRFGAAHLAAKLGQRLTRLLTGPLTWRIGYRRLGGPGILETGTVPETGYSWVPDDGRRFLADPFLIAHRGRTWLFCEEFPYATRTGIISACEIDADGVAGPMRPVLESGSHLSYPFVFAQDGEVWMIPESLAAGEVVLYRATAFPFGWQPERRLLDGIAAADATPILHEGRLWLFASLVGEPGGSSWDALGLFHAPNLGAAFSAHPLNPVLVDAAAARPAGRMYRQGGRLMRLAQDCRARYGAATTVAVIDRLDPEGYAQTVTHRIAPPSSWNAAGLHTIDVGGGYEAIDLLSRTLPVSEGSGRAAMPRHRGAGRSAPASTRARALQFRGDVEMSADGHVR